MGKQRRYPALALTVMHALERAASPGKKCMKWKLANHLPVTARKQAVEKLDCYVLSSDKKLKCFTKS
jgi:hypothetical protein